MTFLWTVRATEPTAVFSPQRKYKTGGSRFRTFLYKFSRMYFRYYGNQEDEYYRTNKSEQWKENRTTAKVMPKCSFLNLSNYMRRHNFLIYLNRSNKPKDSALSESFFRKRLVMRSIIFAVLLC